MTYRAPVADMLFAMTHVSGRGAAEALAAELDPESLAALLDEAARFAGEVIAPLNRVGDRDGVRLHDGHVATAPGWPEAYRRWREGGWSRVAGPSAFGGMNLPNVVQVACTEMWNGASLAFGLCPLLTAGAVETIAAHGSETLQCIYLDKLVSGEWTGTMNLTEPQAGSDLGGVRTKATRADDGSYRITGQKIYITYGEHDLADNIVHLVLARLPEAPAGTRGLSLFLVPKILVEADGSLGARNDVRCAGVEHKLGIHGSPTCTMVYGDAGGAVGWLVGEENRGLACMFTMMNNARLAVGVQGVAVAERATQQAWSFAGERRQGQAAGAVADALPIDRHPDVRRMLLTMHALTQAARCLCFLAADALDRARLDPDGRTRAEAADQASLLTPVAKAFATDIANEVTSLGVQVHGGMGFVEETGAAQHMRDARILAIYEGTNGIQAIDLVTRKLPLAGGAVVAREIDAMRAVVDDLRSANVDVFGVAAPRLAEALAAVERATAFLQDAGTSRDDRLAGATPYLRLFAVARGGVVLARIALASHRLAAAGDSDPAHARRIAVARFFAESVAVMAPALAAAATSGSASLAAAFDA